MIAGGPTIPFSNPAYQPAPPANGIYTKEKPQLSEQSTGGELPDTAINGKKIVSALPTTWRQKGPPR